MSTTSDAFRQGLAQGTELFGKETSKSKRYTQMITIGAQTFEVPIETLWAARDIRHNPKQMLNLMRRCGIAADQRSQSPVPVAAAPENREQAITDICTLANKPNLAAEFIASGASANEVASELHSRMARPWSQVFASLGISTKSNSASRARAAEPSGNWNKVLSYLGMKKNAA